MKTIQKHNPLFWTALLSLVLILASCGKTADLQKQMSGVWEDRLGHEIVEIKLGGKSNAVTVAGTTYAAEVAEMDQDKGRIRLKVKNGSGEKEVWILTQMWEDTDRFNIVFERGSQKEVLIPKKHG